MRINEPFSYLCIGLRLCFLTKSLCMGIKDFSPLCNILISRFRNTKVITPPIWKSLQSCTFGRCKPSYDIVSLKDAILKSRICTRSMRQNSMELRMESEDLR